MNWGGFSGGLSRGISYLGDQVADQINRNRLLEENQRRYELDLALRLGDARRKAEAEQRKQSLMAGIPGNIATLSRSLQGGLPQSYGGVPYEVPASEGGPTSTLEATPFTQSKPWSSTGEMLAEDPAAAQAYGELLQAGQNPFGPGSPIQSVEATRASVDARRRDEEARAEVADVFKDIQDAQAKGTLDPDKALGFSLRMMTAYAKRYPDHVPEAWGKASTWIKDAADVKANGEAAQEMLPLIADGKIDPAERVQLLTIAMKHPKSTMAQEWAKQVAPTFLKELGVEGDIVGTYLGALKENGGDVSAAFKTALDQAMQTPEGRLAFQEATRDEKSPLGVLLKNALGVDNARAQARAKKEGERAGMSQAELEAEAARTELTRAQAERARQPRSGDQAKTISQAQVALDRARRNLDRVERQITDGTIGQEDADYEREQAQSEVDSAQAALARLRQGGATGGKAEVDVRPSARSYSTLSDDQRRARLIETARRLFPQKFGLQPSGQRPDPVEVMRALTAEERQRIAAEAEKGR